MNYFDPNQAEWALQDPNTPGEALAAIAQAHPALRDRVVTHPNAYPQLVTWIAAQSTTVASPPPQTGQPYSPAGPQPYGAAQQYPGQYYPGQPSGPGQQYYGQGYPGQPAKKKTGLVLGLVGGGVVVVVAVVAVLGLTVFHWFGSGSSSAPTLSKSQVETFLGSSFMQDVSSGTSVSGYSYSSFTASQLKQALTSDGCDAMINIMADVDLWEWSSSSGSSTGVMRFTSQVTPDSYISAAKGCADFNFSEGDIGAVNHQDGGWWAKDTDGTVTFAYGNVWLVLPDPGDDQIKGKFKDFTSAVRAAAK